MMTKGKLLRTSYIAIIFPEDKKRNRSAVIHRSLEQRITRYLKGNKDEDKLFRHYDELEINCFVTSGFTRSVY